MHIPCLISLSNAKGHIFEVFPLSPEYSPNFFEFFGVNSDLSCSLVIIESIIEAWCFHQASYPIHFYIHHNTAILLLIYISSRPSALLCLSWNLSGLLEPNLCDGRAYQLVDKRCREDHRSYGLPVFRQILSSNEG